MQVEELIAYGIILYNPGQNIWDKMEKSSKSKQSKKDLMPISARFLTAIAKV